MSDRVPMKHQVEGAKFLAARGFAVLLDQPGLGKTAQTIVAADHVYAIKVLVICPAVVRNHWAREFTNWQKVDRPITVMEGFVKSVPENGVTIVSHAAIADAKSVVNLQSGAPYDVIICDEIHLFRSPDAARARAFWFPGGIWSWSRHVWGLTGTPMVNSAADFWMMTLGPLHMQIDWYDWCLHYCEIKQDNFGGPKPVGIKNEESLAAFLKPHVLRRTFESVGLKLPPLTIYHRLLEIDPAALQRAMAGLENWTPQRLTQALDNNDELRDAAISRVRRALGIAKATDVAEYVHELLLQERTPIVVFFQHTDVRNLLYEELSQKRGYVVSWLDGKITQKQLTAAEQWHQAGKLDVLLVQIDAGGVGITLTRGHRVVVAELPWTAVALNQAIARVHRIGQINPVTADVLRVNGCWLEEALASVVSKKHSAAEKLLTLLLS